jgi:hypothetical protein
MQLLSMRHGIEPALDRKQTTDNLYPNPTIFTAGKCTQRDAHIPHPFY